MKSIFVKAELNLELIEDIPRFIQPILFTLCCVISLLLTLNVKAGPQDLIPMDHSHLSCH